MPATTPNTKKRRNSQLVPSHAIEEPAGPRAEHNRQHEREADGAQRADRPDGVGQASSAAVVSAHSLSLIADRPELVRRFTGSPVYRSLVEAQLHMQQILIVWRGLDDGSRAPILRGMTPALRALSACLVIASTGAASAQAPPRADARTRDIYVSVVDNREWPVDRPDRRRFHRPRRQRRPRGARRRAGHRAAPDRRAVDDSQRGHDAIPYLRDGLRPFLERLQGKAAIGMVTIGERPTSSREHHRHRGPEERPTRIFARPGPAPTCSRDHRGEPRLQKREAKRAGDRRHHVRRRSSSATSTTRRCSTSCTRAAPRCTSLAIGTPSAR